MKDIVLNESVKASALIAGTTKVEDVRTAVSLIARYDVLAAQIPPAEAAAHVKQIAKSLFPGKRVSEYENYVNYCVTHASERQLVRIDSVPITQKELDFICSIDSIRAKCLFFSMLAVVKFETMRCSAVNYWLSGDLRHEVVRRANLGITDNEMADMCFPLIDAGHLAFPKRFDSCSLHVLYVDPEGDPVLNLNEQDFHDLGYCLRAYLGEPYTRCEECGRWIKQAKNGRRRFCNDCAADNQRAIDRKYRSKKRS